MSVNTGSESQESTSTSVSEEGINISFEDIHHSVRNGIFAGGRKSILRGVSGYFNAGELSILMGQSGAGKSTLMDILAGYTKPVSGQLYINGRIRDDKWFRRRSVYIMQDDNLQELLTVEEALRVAADLKLGEHVSKAQKNKRLQEILTAMGLMQCRSTRTINLSGGQKKRLAIGLELVSDPPIMFLDEPTSGLDSSMSKQLVYLLQQLARQGRTVVITMHQPSAVLLQMVDCIYGVVAGRCGYIGSVSMLVPFLDEMKLKCPPFHNPIDFFIEMCAENADSLVAATENGRNTQWITNIPAVLDDDLIAKHNLNLFENMLLTALPPPKEDKTSKILLKLKSTYSTSSWTQFCTLTRRSFLVLWRDTLFTRMVPGIHCMIGLIIGILYYNIAEDAKDMRDNYNYVFFSLMFLMFTAFSVISINFPRELPVVRREHFNRWYTIGSYYAATVASAVPIQTACTLAYAFITYWMTGQPPSLLRFFAFSWMLVQVSFVSLCLGLLNGSLFDIKHAVIFGPFFIMPFTVFSGFFLRYIDAPGFFKWLFHISFLKHGFFGILMSIFGMNRGKLPCSAPYCHYTYPQQFLDNQGFSKDSYGMAVLRLFSILAVIVICTYVILKIRLKNKW